MYNIFFFTFLMFVAFEHCFWTPFTETFIHAYIHRYIHMYFTTYICSYIHAYFTTCNKSHTFSQLIFVSLIVIKWAAVTFFGQQPLVPLLYGPPFFPIIIFGSTTLLTGMTGISLHLWLLSHMSVSLKENNCFWLRVKLHALISHF
jgi:hypothetical protein